MLVVKGGRHSVEYRSRDSASIALHTRTLMRIYTRKLSLIAVDLEGVVLDSGSATYCSIAPVLLLPFIVSLMFLLVAGF